MIFRIARPFERVLVLIAVAHGALIGAPASVAEASRKELASEISNRLGKSLTHIRDSKALLRAAEPLVEGPVWEHLREQLQEMPKTKIKFNVLSDGLVQVNVENRMVTIEVDKEDGEILFNRKKVYIDWFGNPEAEIKKLSDAMPRLNAASGLSRLFFSEAEAALLYPVILAVGAGATVVIQNYYKCGAIESAQKRCEKFATLEKQPSENQSSEAESPEAFRRSILGSGDENVTQYGQALAKTAFMCSKKKALESCLANRGFDVKQLVGNPSLGEKTRKPSGTAK